MVRQTLHLDLQIDRRELDTLGDAEPDGHEVQDRPHPRGHDVVEHRLPRRGGNGEDRDVDLLLLHDPLHLAHGIGGIDRRHEVGDPLGIGIEEPLDPEPAELNPRRPPAPDPGSLPPR